MKLKLIRSQEETEMLPSAGEHSPKDASYRFHLLPSEGCVHIFIFLMCLNLSCVAINTINSSTGESILTDCENRLLINRRDGHLRSVYPTHLLNCFHPGPAHDGFISYARGLGPQEDQFAFSKVPF